MEAGVLISEGEFAQGYIAFQTREGQIKTEEVAAIVERLLTRNV